MHGPINIRFTCIKIPWFLSDFTISNNRGPLAKKFKRLAFQSELADGFRGHPRYWILFTSWVVSTLERDVPCVTGASSLSPTRSCQVRTVKRENGREERVGKLHVKFVCVYLACLFKSQSVRLYARKTAQGLSSYNQANTAETTWRRRCISALLFRENVLLDGQ